MKWEYLIVDGSGEDLLKTMNDLGKQGWELVSVAGDHYSVRSLYFKRPISN